MELVCSKCNETKDSSEFYKQSATKTGFTYYCKACKNATSGYTYKSKPPSRRTRRAQKTWYYRHKHPHGIVYQVVHVPTQFMYIGRTTQTLAKRLNAHKTEARSGRGSKFYEFMREVDCGDFEIEVLQECGEDDNVVDVEAYWIELIRPCLNTRYYGN